MGNYKEEKDHLVVAVDIGTTKICAIAGRRNQYGKVEILAVSKVESEGVSRGVVSNIEKTSRSIRQAVDNVEQRIKAKVKKVYVGIAGQHIRSVAHRGILTRANSHDEIGEKDIEHLISDMYKLVLPPGDTILHVYPQEFTVDNEPGIIDPVGMSGVRLEANFHVVTTQESATSNLKRCFEKAGLEVEEIILEPVASSYAVLSHDEKEAGVALIDIGGGTTDLIVFHEGIIRHTAVIPFGGNIVTRDIKEGCSVMQQQAEKLKIKFGSALAEEVIDNRIITIPGFKMRDNKEISEKNLSLIIQARLEEIFDYALMELKRSGFERKLIGGLVLTGGGALLKHIDLLAEYHTGIQTRLGHPVQHLAHGFQPTLSSPMFATGIGLLMYGIEKSDQDGVEFFETEMKVNTVIPTPSKTIEKVAEETHLIDNEDSGWEWDTKNDTDTSTKKSTQAALGKSKSIFNDLFEKTFKKTKAFFEAAPDHDFK